MKRLTSAGAELENNPAYRAQRHEMLQRNYKPVGVVLGDVNQSALHEYIGKLRLTAEREDVRLVERGLPTELVHVENVNFGEPGVSGHLTGMVIYARSWVADSVRRAINSEASRELTDEDAQAEIEEILSKPADHYFDPDG